MTQSVTFKPEETGPTPPAQVEKKDDAQKPAERPAWLPENFDTPEAFAKSFSDQRAELTRTQQELAKLKKPAEEKPATEVAADDATKKAQEDAAKAAAEASEVVGIDLDPFTKEFAETGDVSEESRTKIIEALEKNPIFKGKAKGIVNDYIEGQKLRGVNYNTEVMSAAGGQDGYTKLIEFAKTAYSEAEQKAYDTAVTSGDVTAAKLAVEALKQRYESENGKDPVLLDGEQPSQGEGYASTYEMVQAMSDPRYGKDPAYTAQVVAKTKRSNF